MDIVPEGTNSHASSHNQPHFRLLSTADVVYLNRLELEEPKPGQLAEANLADDAEIVELGEQTITEGEYLFDDSFPEEDGKVQPPPVDEPVDGAALRRDRPATTCPPGTSTMRLSTPQTTTRSPS